MQTLRSQFSHSMKETRSIQTYMFVSPVIRTQKRN